MASDSTNNLTIVVLEVVIFKIEMQRLLIVKQSAESGNSSRPGLDASALQLEPV